MHKALNFNSHNKIPPTTIATFLDCGTTTNRTKKNFTVSGIINDLVHGNYQGQDDCDDL